MLNTINVYWSCLEEEWVRAEPPVSVLSDFMKKNKNSETLLQLCPAFHKELHNVFGIQSIYDYEFTFNSEKNEVYSSQYGQDFFNRHVRVRSLKERSFTLDQKFVFFTDDPSLNMSGEIFPYLENNNITERCIVYGGQFDIGKWYRPLEFAFQLKEKYDTFKIEAGEIYQYIRFHTNKKIKFIQFRETLKLKEYLHYHMAVRWNKKGYFSLDYLYNKFKMKKYILKEIRDNLL